MLEKISEGEIHEAVRALSMAKIVGMLEEVVDGCFEECQQKKDIRGMAKLAIALNWACWKYFEDGDRKTAKHFEEWWQKAENIIYTSGLFTEEEQTFYAHESD